MSGHNNNRNWKKNEVYSLGYGESARQRFSWNHLVSNFDDWTSASGTSTFEPIIGAKWFWWMFDIIDCQLWKMGGTQANRNLKIVSNYRIWMCGSLPRSLLFKNFLHGSVCCTIFVAPSLVCLIDLFSMVDVVIASVIELKPRAEYCFLSLVTPVG